MGFSLVAASRGYFPVAAQRRITAEPFPVAEHGVDGHQQLWHMGSVVESTGSLA